MTDKPMTAAGQALWEICSQPRDGLGWVTTHILAIEEQAVAAYLASDAFTEALVGALAVGDPDEHDEWWTTPRKMATAIAAAMRGEQE